MNHLRPLLPLRLGLLRDGSLHFGRQVDVLDLDHGNLDPPGIGVLVQDLLELVIESLPLTQEVIQLHLPQDRAQRGLGQL